MRIEDCFLLGRVLKAHSLHGECKAYFDVDDIEDYEELESVYLLQGNQLTPFFVEYIRPQGPNLAIVKFRGVDGRNQADDLHGTEMYLPADQLPTLSDQQFYFHEIKGFTLVDDKLGPLGQVLRVDEFPAQAVIVMRWQGREVLIPVVSQFVGKIDREARTLQTHLPDGLVDIYMGGGESDQD